jgi:mRNA interferase ChpB
MRSRGWPTPTSGAHRKGPPETKRTDLHEKYDYPTKEFNKLGDVLVAPITQGGDFSRYAGFAVALTGTGCKTQGVALINKIRMLDLAARKARKVERVSQEVIDDALGRLLALLD